MGKSAKKNAQKLKQLRKSNRLNNESVFETQMIKNDFPGNNNEEKSRKLADKKEPAKEEKKNNKKAKKIKIAIATMVMVVALFVGYLFLPKFHDLTVELGTDSISIAEFMNKYAIGSKVAFVTDPNTIEIDKVGDTEIVLRQGSREETVTLSVVDTTAPEVKYLDSLESGLLSIPEADDYVEEIFDYDTTTVKYITDISSIKEYGDYDVEIAVTDASGNETRFTSSLSCIWLKKEAIIELGHKITFGDLLLEPDIAENLLDKDKLAELNKKGVGEYTMESTFNGKTLTCKVTIQDTTPPTLNLRNVSVYLTQSATMKDFIVSYWDASGSVDVKLLTPLKLDSIGSQTVQIEARDANGNVTVGKATLTVKRDDVPPEIRGLSTLTVNKHSQPNYEAGVSAVDAIDGKVSFTVNASAVNVDAAGTYYATYTASDTKGNKASYKRKIVVNHDYEDTRALLDQYYANIPDKSPLGICQYVKKIEYSTNWGGSDPAWFGLTQKNGNCYVHAIILQEMLNRAGYSNRLIWVNSKAHYWNIVYYNGAWWHLDATYLRGNPPLMCGDEAKYNYCKSRGWGDWNRDNWPACNG